MTKFNEQLLAPPSGFPDLGPKMKIAEQRVLDVIRKHYEAAGFLPIETPLVERTEVLTAKSEGEIGTQIYGLRLLNPAPDAPTDEKSLALRFDQTVPLARFVAGNRGQLSFPFRRYAIGPVFRGERPKAGRFRQFTQADIDTIGIDTLDVLHDAEVIATIAHIFNELKIGDFKIRINNRKALESVLRAEGISDVTNAIKEIDAIEKRGHEATVSSLALLIALAGYGSHDGTEERTRAERIVSTLNSYENKTDDTLAMVSAHDGADELAKVISGLRALGVPEKNFTIDLSIARGLSYYTGTVFETRLEAHPEIGSIASGGRYENLVGAFVDKNMPGVGASIGVTRLVTKLIDAGVIETNVSCIAPVVVLCTDIESIAPLALAVAQEVRMQDIACETYMVNRALGKQLEYASKRGFHFAIIIGEQEVKDGTVIVKNLKLGEQATIPRSDLAVYMTTHI